MALATNAGLVDDQDILQNERVVDMDNVITMLDPDVSQFTTILMKIAKTTAISTKSEWLEDQLYPRLSSVASGGGSDSATITVASGEGVYFRVGDMVRNAHTGCAFRVTGVAGDVLTPSAVIGRVTFSAHSASDQLLIVGNASAQGATLGTRKQTKRVAQYNYSTIQRNPYGFTRSLMAEKLYGGPVPDKERQKKAIEHKRAIEYTAFWGTRGLDTSGSEPIGQSGGLFEFVTTNVKNASGSLTTTLLDSYMRDFLQHGNADSGILVVSPVVAGAISGFLRNAWTPAATDLPSAPRLWGVKVDGFVSGSFGFKVPVIVKRDWNDFSTASTQYGGWGFYICLDNVEMPYLRNTELLRDRQANDADSYDEEYLTEFTMKVKQEQTHGIITGVTG